MNTWLFLLIAILAVCVLAFACTFGEDSPGYEQTGDE